MILDASNPLFDTGVLLEKRIERNKKRIYRVEKRRRIFINFSSLVVQDRSLYRPRRRIFTNFSSLVVQDRGLYIDQSTRP